MLASVKNVWQSAADLALDAIFPHRCIACRAWSNHDFCAPCHAALQPITAPFCARCGAPFAPDSLADVCADCRGNRAHKPPPFDLLRSVFRFEGTIRHAVHRFKYEGRFALAAPLAQEMVAWLENQDAALPWIPVERIAVIAPVPLHTWRRWRRGYNQSALLAQKIAAHLQKVRPHNGVLFADVLRRVRYTSPQVELGREARGENVRGAFEMNPQFLHLQGGAVLLIDDVCTTGATIRECARVLKSAGVEEVYALTLARQV